MPFNDLLFFLRGCIDQFSFKNVGSAIPGGLPREQKMMQ